MHTTARIMSLSRVTHAYHCQDHTRLDMMMSVDHKHDALSTGQLTAAVDLDKCISSTGADLQHSHARRLSNYVAHEFIVSSHLVFLHSPSQVAAHVTVCARCG